MNKIDKFLRKLSAKERSIVFPILRSIMVGNEEGLNMKKLSGHRNMFRVRVADFRIIFERNASGTAIREISRRNENTYKL